MAENRNTPNVYYIPPNYAEGGRILQGFVRTRYLIDACGLSLPMVVLSLIIGKGTTTSIVLISILAAPVFVAGLVGYNGDPLSTTLKNYINWKKNRTEMRYDITTNRFAVSPTDTIFATEVAKDKLVGYYEDYRQKQLDKRMNSLSDDQEFEFAEDPSVRRFSSANTEEPDTVIMNDDIEDALIMNDDEEDFFGNK